MSNKDRTVYHSPTDNVMHGKIIMEGLPWNDDSIYCVIFHGGIYWGCKHYPGTGWETREELAACNFKASQKPIQVKAGQIFSELINQANRVCEIVKVTKTRFRIEYELPKAGLTKSWRYHEEGYYFK